METESRIKEIIKNGNIICVSGDGSPFVKVSFRTLEEAHKLHRFLISAKADSDVSADDSSHAGIIMSNRD